MNPHRFLSGLVVLVVLAGSLLSGCQAVPAGVNAYTGVVTPVGVLSAESEPVPGLNITVDPRMELLAVVQFLSSYDRRTNLITQQDFAYKDEVRKTFEPYRKHAAVRIFDKMSKADFSFDAPPAVMLYLTPPPELIVHTAFTPYLLRRAGGEAQLGEFITALRDFAVQTHFADFFSSHREFYAGLSSAAAALLASGDDLALMEQYYGMEQHSYNIILVPLFHAGGFGPMVARLDGTFDIYSIGGPYGVDAAGLPAFGTPEEYRYLIWHEFAHSFVNPLTTQHLETVSAYEDLYQKIAPDMKKLGYPNWEIAVNEHIVRAITVRLTAHALGHAAAEQALERERQQGFVYIDKLSARLEEYESNRDRYPTFSAFYSALIEVFAGEKL